MTTVRRDGEVRQPEWSIPRTPDGQIDWKAPSSRDPELGFYVNWDEKRAAKEADARAFEALARREQVALERELLKQGRGNLTPEVLAGPEAITLEFAMATDTATVRLSYLVDPYLPSACVVGFYGRGGSAKSSFLASLAARISREQSASTLWVSVEEPPDWIKVRHIRIGGVEETLAVVKAVASKTDAQGRVIASNFNVYEHLEPAVLKACDHFNTMTVPRPLRLVVLDTAVGLTTWAKNESPNDDASVKRLLGYLQALAERHGVTVAIIGHSNKGKHDHFADTVAGASAWTNSPRLSFVHARDRREEFACVVMVAKSNLTQRFAAAYTTEPVHTLHERDEGADSVLCRVDFGKLVWGEEEAGELYEEATRRPREDEEGGGGDHKPSVVSQMATAVSQMVQSSAQPVTRDIVETLAGRTFSRREWTKADDMLGTASFIYKVGFASGPQNKRLYVKLP